MKVTVDKNSGFCWGVVRTVEIAEAELGSSENGPGLYSLGEIIHNPMEIERLEKKGLKTVSHADLENLAGARVLIRAHGEPPETFRRARELGIAPVVEKPIVKPILIYRSKLVLKCIVKNIYDFFFAFH